MEQLPKFGTAISDIIMPTHQAYASLLQKQAAQIKSTACETYSYGPHTRQQFDVYTPSAGAKPVTNNANSVLIFLYGGGLVRGDKINKMFLDGIVYANLGHYFAENLGIKVVVVDYRLLSHGAVFPSGGEDVSLAIDEVIRQSGSEASNPLDIYIMGNSAGGLHTSTYLLAPDFAESRQRLLGDSSGPAKLKGVILLSVPLHFGKADPSREETLRTYFDEQIEERCPLGLLKAAKQNGTIEDLRKLPVLAPTGTLDPEDEVLIPVADFVKEWRSIPSVASNLSEYTMEGHNHISPVLAVGTGVPAEEAWARQVINFIVASSKK